MKTILKRTGVIWFLIAGLVLIAGCSIDVNPSNTNGKVDLAWDANSGEAVDGYKVYLGTESGNYAQAIDVGNVQEFTVTGLQGGTQYYFAITAYNDAGESVLSDEISHTIPVEAVQVSVDKDGDTSGTAAQ